MSRSATEFYGRHKDVEVTFDVDDGSIECVLVYVESAMQMIEIKLEDADGLTIPFVQELQKWVNDQLPTYANDTPYDEPDDDWSVA